MNFLKYLCCKEQLSAAITTGDFKTLPGFAHPMLEVHIQLTMGEVTPSTDFLYLQPQVEQSRDPHSLIGGEPKSRRGTLGTAPSPRGTEKTL